MLGDNQYGQLGNGTTTDSTEAVEVPGIVGATAVTGGRYHSCALLAGGAVKCWGMAPFIGDGVQGSNLLPVDVVDVTGATAIAVADHHTCAVVAGRAVKCWGLSIFGEVGTGLTNHMQPTPFEVPGVTGATAVALGDGHSCALLVTGAIKCWGWNVKGQMGNGTNGTTGPSSDLVTVTGVAGATSVTGGYEHSCAVLAGGTLKCRGSNARGELGNGTLTDSATAVDVVGIP